MTKLKSTLKQLSKVRMMQTQFPKKKKKNNKTRTKINHNCHILLQSIHEHLKKKIKTLAALIT